MTNDFLLIKNFFDNNYYKKILEWVRTLRFISGYTKSGKKIDRDQIWFDDKERYFCKLWKQTQERWKPHHYPKMLLDIQEKIKRVYDVDTCLINRYNSGKDTISAHKDNMISFGETPTILIYSLGCTRTLRINRDNGEHSFCVNLPPNSMFIMSGDSQRFYTHELIEDDTKETRWSLTFRKFLG